MALNRAGSCNPAVVKIGITFLGLCLVGYLLGPPLYWHVLEGLAAVRRSSSAASCPPCNCDCDSQPLLSIPQGTSISILSPFLIIASDLSKLETLILQSRPFWTPWISKPFYQLPLDLTYSMTLEIKLLLSKRLHQTVRKSVDD